jgi:hypothetical protein
MHEAIEPRQEVCPYCGESVEVTIEPFGMSSETYVEDCPVCCRPWQVRVTRQDGEAQVELGRDDD